VQSTIVDSGALVAMFRTGDRNHQRISEAIKGAQPLLTTRPCVTEAMHILPRLPQQLALLAFIRRGGLTVREFTAAHLERFIIWMQKYADRPMDFADASLVWLAQETGVLEILTIDRADFATYRVPAGKGHKRFRLVPERL
jgi:predicted nucleic acid-binding protein